MRWRGLIWLACVAAVLAGALIHVHRTRQPAQAPPPEELPAPMPAPEPIPEPLPTPAPRPQDRAPEIIATLMDLCRYLKSAPVTDQQVARRLGTILEDQGRSSGFVLQPYNPLFRRVFVGHPWEDEEDRKNKTPSSIDFDLTDPALLTVAQLVAAFGPYDVGIRHHPDAPQVLGFAWGTQPPGPIDCTLLADTRSNPEGREDQTPVLTVSIRPDPRLRDDK